MRIEYAQDITGRREAVHDVIADAHASGPVPEPVCRPDGFSHDREEACGRACRSACTIPSSDPARHPLDAAIAPLAYELKRTGVFEPCWSCEGHETPGGEIWKWPQVWFHATSVVHLRALSDAVACVYASAKLAAPWHVVVAPSDPGTPETTFALKPSPDSACGLGALHADIGTLAAALPVAFRSACDTIRRWTEAA